MSEPLSPTARRDIASLIHPSSNLARHRKVGPLTIRKGEGVFVEDEEGNRYLEGLAGLWSASLGFSEPRLAEAAARQFAQLPFYHLFNSRSHDTAIDLAEKLLKLAPEGLVRVLFANSGSEANDQAVKLVWFYHNAIGKPAKKKIIGRHNAYHGATAVAASISGPARGRAAFDLPLPGFIHTDAASFYHYGRPGETEDAFVTRILGNLEALIEREGADTIGAFFAEPINAAGGVALPPKGYFERLQAILHRHDILFVVDEVITGFGRTGNVFASETYGLKPDLLTVAKALSASYLPISATLVSGNIHEALLAAGERGGDFAHGYTYGGHPVSAAVALEALKIYEERDTIGHVRAVAPHFAARLARLAAHPLVGEVRSVGLIGAIEIAQDKTRRRPFAPEEKVTLRIAERAQAHGVLVRGQESAIVLCPPLIITREEIDLLFDALDAALEDTLAELRQRGSWPAVAAE